MTGQQRSRTRWAAAAGGAILAVAAVAGATHVIGDRDGDAPDSEHDAAQEVARTPYRGPLHLAAGEGRHPRAGAAGDVVDCSSFGEGGAFTGEVYSEGATSDTPREAVETARTEGVGWTVPKDLVVAAESGARVLFVAEVDGSPKAALVVRDGQGSEGAGGDGWYVESWAVCDVVELPDVARELGYQVWTDAQGEPVPTRVLAVTRGPEHCDWQEMTFLRLGGDSPRGRTFVGAPVPSLSDYLAEPYRARTALPADAVDTGYRHGEDRLWLAPDRARAYVGANREEVALWPLASEKLGCL